jgi:nicotinic acid mononucleotide adenylyltransferase
MLPNTCCTVGGYIYTHPSEPSHSPLSNPLSNQGKPQEPLPDELQTLLRDHYAEDVSALHEESSGLINIQAISAHDISATQIRENLKHGVSVKYLLPEDVVGYIQQHQLYQA